MVIGSVKNSDMIFPKVAIDETSGLLATPLIPKLRPVAPLNVISSDTVTSIEKAEVVWAEIAVKEEVEIIVSSSNPRTSGIPGVVVDENANVLADTNTANIENSRIFFNDIVSIFYMPTLNIC